MRPLRADRMRGQREAVAVVIIRATYHLSSLNLVLADYGMMVAAFGRAFLLFVCVFALHPTPVHAFWSVYSGWTGAQLPPEDVIAIRLHHGFQTVHDIPSNVNWFAKSMVERWNAEKKSAMTDTDDAQRL